MYRRLSDGDIEPLAQDVTLKTTAIWPVTDPGKRHHSQWIWQERRDYKTFWPRGGT